MMQDRLGLGSVLWAKLSPHPGIGSLIMQFTAVYLETPEGYTAFVEELQGTSSHGATLEEARNRLVDAIRVVFDQNRELVEGTLGLANMPFKREPLAV